MKRIDLFMKKLIFSIVLFLFITGQISAINNVAAETLCERITENPNAKKLGEFEVLSIIDGDTIIIKDKKDRNVHIRTIGVNAPETAKGLEFRDGKISEAEPFADEATKFVKEAIKASDNKVELYREGREKSYERFLCWVIVNTPNGKRELGELLVANGLAKVYKNDFIPDAKEKEILVKLEAKAQQDKKGIWQSQQNKDYKDVATANKSSGNQKTLTSEQSKKELNSWLNRNGYANINAKGQWGYSPLHTAARQHNTAIVKLLLAEGAAVDAKDVNDWTPLHRISRDGGKDIAELLIAKGADVNARTDHGKTPLRLAEDAGNADIANLLRQHGGKK